MTKLRQRMLEDLRVRNHSPETGKVYIDRVAKFAQHFNKSPHLLGPKHVRSYQVYLVDEKKCSATPRSCPKSSARLPAVNSRRSFLYKDLRSLRREFPWILGPDSRRQQPRPADDDRHLRRRSEGTRGQRRRQDGLGRDEALRQQDDDGPDRDRTGATGYPIPP